MLAVRAFHGLGDVREWALQQIDLAGALIDLGVHKEARAALLDSLAAGERLGVPGLVASAVSQLGVAHARLGDLTAAHSCFERALTLFAEQRNRRMEATCRVHLARALIAERRHDAALREALLASQLASTAAHQLPYALASGAKVLLALGRTDEAM